MQAQRIIIKTGKQSTKEDALNIFKNWLYFKMVTFQYLFFKKIFLQEQ